MKIELYKRLLMILENEAFIKTADFKTLNILINYYIFNAANTTFRMIL